MNIQYQNESIIVFESALYRTTSCLIQTPDCILLVDPNWLPIEIEFIKKQLVQLGKQHLPKYLLFTHSDYDHILAYKAFPNSKVICSKIMDNKKDKEKILQQIYEFDQEYYISRSYPIEFPTADITISSNNQQIMIGNTKLEFYLAPGHTEDGIFIFIESLNCLIVGDYLSNVEFPFIDHSSEAYLSTLDLAKKIIDKKQVDLLVSGHGDICRSRDEVYHRISHSKNYIEELKASLTDEIAFDLEKWLGYYDYPHALRESHANNLKQLSRELGE